MKLTISLLFILISISAFAHTKSIDKDLLTYEKYNVHAGKKEIVLTFDDGPHAKYTPKVLDVLDHYGIQATFFVRGDKAKEYPEIMKDIVKRGHLVGHHSFGHEAVHHYHIFNRKKWEKKFWAAHQEILPYYGNQKKFYYRPPEGSWSQWPAKRVNKRPPSKNYIGPILWDIGGMVRKKNGKVLEAADWACWTKKTNFTVQQCLEGYMNNTNSKGGGVVLLHDIHSKTVEMLPLYIEKLLKKGYQFINMDAVDFPDS